MNYLSLEQLLALHVLAIEQFGGSKGLRDLGQLESALTSQRQEVFGEELYQDIYEKAAAVCRGVIGDHPFIDGNKRTAVLAALTLIEINGIQFKAKKGELEDFAVKVAAEHLDVPTIAAWLRAHSR